MIFHIPLCEKHKEELKQFHSMGVNQNNTILLDLDLCNCPDTLVCGQEECEEKPTYYLRLAI